jgi:hypothetical protein
MQKVKRVTFQVKKEHIFMMLIHHQDIRNPLYLTTLFTGFLLGRKTAKIQGLTSVQAKC